MAALSFVRDFPLVRPFVRRLSNLKAETFRRYRDRRLPDPIYDTVFHIGNRDAVKRYQRAQGQMSLRPIEEKIVRDLREDGVSIVDIADLFPTSPLPEIQAWAENIVAKPAHQERIKLVEGGGQPDDRSGKFYLMRLLGSEPELDYRDAAVNMSLSAPMLRIASSYLGMFSRLAWMDLWYNIPTGGEPVMSQNWHRDPEDKKMIKTFLYLRDVDEAGGPFCFVPGTHNDGRLNHIRPHTPGGYLYPEKGFIEKTFSPDQIRVCTGKAGTLIFADTTGFHKGGAPTKNARLLYNGMYATNGSIPVVLKSPRYTIKGSPTRPFDELASYAIGHLGAGK